MDLDLSFLPDGYSVWLAAAGVAVVVLIIALAAVDR